MPLFERNYKAAAVADLERRIRELEEKDKKAESKTDFVRDAASLGSNLNFAERLNLISSAQADELRQRIVKAHLDFERMQKTETRDDMVDSFENPRERAARYQGMDSYNAQIAQERAKANADKSNGEPSHTISYEADERAR